MTQSGEWSHVMKEESGKCRRTLGGNDLESECGPGKSGKMIKK